MGMLHILGPEGDTKVAWGTNTKTEVDEAQETFEGYIEKKYLAFQVLSGKNVRVEEFDETADKVVMFPQIVGG